MYIIRSTGVKDNNGTSYGCFIYALDLGSFHKDYWPKYYRKSEGFAILIEKESLKIVLLGSYFSYLGSSRDSKDVILDRTDQVLMTKSKVWVGNTSFCSILL